MNLNDETFVLFIEDDPVLGLLKAETIHNDYQ